MNRIGSAVADVAKLKRNLNTTVKFASQFDKLNNAYNVAKGAGAMTESIRKMSVASALPTKRIEAAIQPGN